MPSAYQLPLPLNLEGEKAFFAREQAAKQRFSLCELRIRRRLFMSQNEISCKSSRLDWFISSNYKL